MRTSDFAVVGAGIVGLATAYALRERGASVVVYERGTPGSGQSGGDSRIFRHGHDDPRLIEFARESRRRYRDWGDEFGVELVSDDGAVLLGPFAHRRLALIERVGGIEASALSSAELAERMPWLAEFEGPAMLDGDGGSIRAAAAVAALAERLEGAIVREEVVALWQTASRTIEVRTVAGRAEHGGAIVCAGVDTARFARTFGVSIPAQISLHGRVSFQARGDPPGRVACLQDGGNEFGEPGAYGAPSPDSTRFSIGVNASAPAREDASVILSAELGSITDRAVAYVSRALPGLRPEPLGYRHCWVTQLPWHPDGFAVWEADQALFVYGENLFKHAPALGAALANAALTGALADELLPTARLGLAPEQATPGAALRPNGIGQRPDCRRVSRGDQRC